MNKTILVVDDERDIRGLVCGILSDEGYETREAANSDAVYEMLSAQQPDLIVLDIWLEGSADDGLEILAKVKAQYPFVPVIMISGHGTVETAVAAIKVGAYDFIEKPFKSDRLILMAQRAIEASGLMQENETLRNQQDSIDNVVDLPAVDGAGEDLMGYPLKEARQRFEREYLLAQLARFDGNVSKTAAFVGMDRAALHRKMKNLAVDENEADNQRERNAT